MKKGLLILIVLGVLIAGFLLFLFVNHKSEDSIRTLTCYDKKGLSGKAGLPIPCSTDSECDSFNNQSVERMKQFCSPAEVGFYECGFRDFCGEDGYCKHDCGLG